MEVGPALSLTVLGSSTCNMSCCNLVRTVKTTSSCKGCALQRHWLETLNHLSCGIRNSIPCNKCLQNVQLTSLIDIKIEWVKMRFWGFMWLCHKCCVVLETWSSQLGCVIKRATGSFHNRAVLLIPWSLGNDPFHISIRRLRLWNICSRCNGLSRVDIWNWMIGARDMCSHNTHDSAEIEQALASLTQLLLGKEASWWGFSFRSGTRFLSTALCYHIPLVLATACFSRIPPSPL